MSASFVWSLKLILSKRQATLVTDFQNIVILSVYLPKTIFPFCVEVI